MHRLTPIVGAALAAGAIASAVAVSSGGAETPAGQTITLVERSNDANTVFIDAPPLVKGKNGMPSKGDSFLFKTRVLDGAGATRLGKFVARCTLLSVTKQFTGSEAICDGVYVLRDGTITVSTVFTVNNKPTPFAVTGGTGAYAGARGSGTSTERPKSSPFLDTVIQLLP